MVSSYSLPRLPNAQSSIRNHKPSPTILQKFLQNSGHRRPELDKTMLDLYCGFHYNRAPARYYI